MPEIELRKNLQKNLAILMEKRGITQNDIAEKLGVTAATVSYWCSGRAFPRADKLEKLAELFGVGISALAEEDGLKNLDDQDRLEALHQNPRLGMLFDRQRKMSDSDIDFMIQMADRILKERDGDD